MTQDCYKFLTPGDIVQRGDEFYDHDDEEWTREVIIGRVWQDGSFPTRRKIDADCPEAPRWIPVTERMPTAEDGMKGSTNRTDEGKVLWMTLRGGWHAGHCGNAPDYAVAWCHIPAYGNPVPTPEDPVRVAFEKWAIDELDDDLYRYVEGQYVHESVRCAWAAWQAAREGAKVPEPVEPSQEDIDWEEFRAWVASKLGAHYSYIERNGNMFAAFLAGKAKGGAQL
jgi:hypothetical protein